MAERIKCRLVNVHHGVGKIGGDDISHLIYANLVDLEGGCMITATLDYVLAAITARNYELVGTDVPFVKSWCEMGRGELKTHLGIKN